MVLWPAHLEVEVVLIVTSGVTIGLMPIVILLLLAVVVVAHTALLVSTQLMISPFDHVLSVYVTAPVPTGLPFLRHWYAGLLPPLVGTAVNTTVDPLQTGLFGVVICNEGVTDCVTFIVTQMCIRDRPSSPLCTARDVLLPS